MELEDIESALENGDIETSLKAFINIMNAEQRDDQHRAAEKKSAEIRLELDTARQLETEALARTKHLRSYF